MTSAATTRRRVTSPEVVRCDGGTVTATYRGSSTDEQQPPAATTGSSRLMTSALLVCHVIRPSAVCQSTNQKFFKVAHVTSGTRWPSGTVPDFAIARSWVRLPPVAAVYQRQLGVSSLRGRLMSTSESWGVNGHTTRSTSPVSEVLQLWLVSG